MSIAGSIRREQLTGPRVAAVDLRVQRRARAVNVGRSLSEASVRLRDRRTAFQRFRDQFRPLGGAELAGPVRRRPLAVLVRQALGGLVLSRGRDMLAARHGRVDRLYV
jgi:hypothetical protein